MSPKERKERREQKKIIQKTKQNLRERKQKLMRLLRRDVSHFRSDRKIQLELNRVISLSTKLNVSFSCKLEHEVLRSVMES
jgi:hypothetical protein